MMATKILLYHEATASSLVIIILSQGIRPHNSHLSLSLELKRSRETLVLTAGRYYLHKKEEILTKNRC